MEPQTTAASPEGIVPFEVPPAVDSNTPAPVPATELEVATKAPAVEDRFGTGAIVSDGQGTTYVITKHPNGRRTLRLQFPKVRGKAARKALKRERQRLARRGQLSSLEAARKYVGVDWDVTPAKSVEVEL